MSAARTILEIKHISKVFPGVRALDNVSMSFREGEVHALLGENGAGKSTLIKILTGAQPPSEGSIVIGGMEYPRFTPIMAKKMGISAIYQEFNLIPHLDIAENIFYGRELTKGLFLDKERMYKLTEQYCHDMGIMLNPRTLVKDLGIAQQQIVEIVKSVSTNAKILIMDEPSAPLTSREIEAMFKIVKKLQDNGVTIIYISHRLEELFEICDRVTIMRDGKYIKTEGITNTNRQSLIAAMVGRELGESYPEKNHTNEEVVMEVKGLQTNKLKDISFHLKKGEILGFGGLVGAGRTELAKAIYGADPIKAGQVILRGRPVLLKSPEEAIRHGIGLLPEDRKHSGLILELSIKENITFGILKKLTLRGFINKKKENELCEMLIRDLHIKTPNMMQKARNLSGGNQQKVVIAKWLASNCDILIFDEPTRGIDIGAKQEIYMLLRELVEQGKSIIMISSDMPELIGMSDRILVMHEGRITGELKKDEFSQQKVLELASLK